MGKFLATEKIRQTAFKRQSPFLSEPARAAGIYRKKPRPFCIPRDFAEENLFSEIRTPALSNFGLFRASAMEMGAEVGR